MLQFDLKKSTFPRNPNKKALFESTNRAFMTEARWL